MALTPQKISARTSLTGANVAAGDLVPVTDVSASGAAKNAVMTFAEFVIGLVAQGLVSTATLLTLPFASRARRNAAYFEDFLDINSVGLQDRYAIIASGTSAAAAQVATSGGRFGVVRGDLGTTNTGRVRVSSPNIGAITAGIGQLSLNATMALNTLSTTAERYSCRLGFIDSGTGECTDAIMFRYDSEVNGGKWECVCRAAGVETASAIDSGVAPSAGVYQKFSIVVNAAGTSAVFSIDGAVVATVTANIPTGANAFGWGVMALKSVGTTATTAFLLDFWEIEQSFAVAR